MRVFHQSYSPPTVQALSSFLRLPTWFAQGICWSLLVLILLSPVASCGDSALHSGQKDDSSPSGFRIASTAFKEGEAIPSLFTCEGADVSPALRWTNPPTGTQSFALIVEDPDAPGGVWTHWVLYNLSAQTRAMDANVAKQGRLPGRGFQGLNSFGRIGYGGPCPPPGKAHRYFFRLYALDTMLSLQPGSTKQDVLATAKGHILGETQLMGRFKR